MEETELMLVVLCLCGGFILSAAAAFAVWYFTGRDEETPPGPASEDGSGNQQSPSSTTTAKSGAEVSGETLTGGSGSANLTFFDDAQGGTGVKFSAYPIKWNGKDVFPVAVHQQHFQEHAYKVLEVRVEKTGKVFLGHVVDMCDKDDGPCKNAFKNGRSFLIDLHKTGWNASGLKTGIESSTYKVVGRITPNDLPREALDGYIFCSCKNATCDLEDAVWKPPGKC